MNYGKNRNVPIRGSQTDALRTESVQPSSSSYGLVLRRASRREQSSSFASRPLRAEADEFEEPDLRSSSRSGHVTQSPIRRQAPGRQLSGRTELPISRADLVVRQVELSTASDSVRRPLPPDLGVSNHRLQAGGFVGVNSKLTVTDGSFLFRLVGPRHLLPHCSRH